MARQANYEAKIEKLEVQIATTSEKIEKMKAELADLKKKKSERDYRALLDYMQENEISAEEAISKLQSENTEENNDQQ